MRLIIQRVLRGCVTVDGKIVGKIGKGAHVLLGLTHGDTEVEMMQMIERLIKLNLWQDGKSTLDQKSWNTNVIQNNFDFMIVSQFTLYGFLKGNKPDFHKSMDHEKAEELYNKFVSVLRAKYIPEKVQTGSFGNYMNVELENDGPVTIQLDSVATSKPEEAHAIEEKKSIAPSEGKEEQKSG
eukprot:TRINITY_DN44503_c0_g1_i1.p1 TRINITY_DN44503_c0_g1~~TRINITY_DN44503_c0_g1_i1.p1  ORF type:complete len:182 (+),score=38.84 TRINITY_DN44503_c0_g1_i1:30-575(+)